MFGTDRLVLSAHNGWRDYRINFQNVLKSQISQSQLDKIMFANSDALFKVGAVDAPVPCVTATTS
ncbi:hypothetical protein EYC98_07555 [Halieaceae bacterium IMCC14734]|uniref:Amidohydrolase-related domain-containing protein n=1 Tax=Candidatus Litorirhabdus singularis TaxID=2518993 RepID=A0ABT3TEM3_9GAMM|nr:hypothetical protein [Candidatus Litorirhabdus singularis]MCX2980733.1 hypothetical protein [Candidatus Litorirhabdus singularis]